MRGALIRCKKTHDLTRELRIARTLEDNYETSFNPGELLAWSAVHGLASIFIDGPTARHEKKHERKWMAADMLKTMKPAVAG